MPVSCVTPIRARNGLSSYFRNGNSELAHSRCSDVELPWIWRDSGGALCRLENLLRLPRRYLSFFSENRYGPLNASRKRTEPGRHSYRGNGSYSPRGPFSARFP